jgi:pimeloyl-ACP methyl ester carboxylesterase
MIESHELRELGIGIRVLEAGDRDATEAVVFLHGQPGSADDWRDLIARLAPSGRCVAFDWPGWGESERPSRASWDFSAGASANLMAAILASLGVRRAHLVMHDLGGVGLLWAAAHREAFASAVIIDTGVLIGFRWHPVARLMRSPIGDLLLALATRTTFRAVIRAYNPQPRKLPRAVVDRWWSKYPLATRRAMLSFYRATPEGAIERLREPLAALDTPALVLWGRHDPAVPVEQAERQRQSFPSAEVVVLEDSGHWPYLDDPEGAAAAIVPFLEHRLTARRAGARAAGR